MIQLNQIRCFVVLARELHFGRAAQKLNMTQPPLTRQIQQLEAALGVTLLDRDRRVVTLTAAGQAFLPEAEYLLQVSESAQLAAQRAFKGQTGRVTIGHVAGATFQFLPDLVTAAGARLPDVDIELIELTTEEQIDALRRGQIDLGLVRRPPASNDFESVCVVREPFDAAIPDAHPLADEDLIEVKDLDGQPFIMYAPGRGGYFHGFLTRIFEAQQVQPRYVQFMRNTHSILALVNAGLGMALLPVSSSRMRYERVVRRPVQLPAAAVAKLYLLWQRKQDKEQPVIEETRRFILSRVQAN